MTFNGVDLTQYITGITTQGRGLEKEKDIEEIPGTNPLETTKLDNLNTIIVHAKIHGSSHSDYRTKVANLKSTLSGTTERTLSFSDSTNTWNVFVESLTIEPHQPISSCLSADVEIKFRGRLA